MRQVLTIVVTAGITLSAIAWAGAQQARPVANTSTSIDEVLEAVRADLQEDRADIIGKNLTLSGDQAARFWPMYQSYQKEQSAIMDEQLKGIQQYIERFDTLTDAGALALINAHIDRDARIAALRKKWLPDFQKALGTKAAVRAMQIDRRLSLAHQMQFVAKIPLAH